MLHASGVVDKGLLIELDTSRVQWMFAPKAVGAWYLHVAASKALLDAACFDCLFLKKK